MNSFLKCMIDGAEAECVYQLMERIRTGPGFSIDETGKIAHQWSETCSHKLFEEWLVEGIQAGAIRAVDNQLAEQHKKHLRIKLGFPYQERHEGIYIEVAAVTAEKMLISEDIDFWSPRDKLSTPERRSEIIREGKGEVFKYLRKRVGISVLNVLQASQAPIGA